MCRMCCALYADASVSGFKFTSVLNVSCNLYAAVLFQLFARAQLAANVTSVGNLKVVQNKA